ncbi:MAG: OmpH family outer membrane protein [Prevotellaceae bacterium]|nr:OmpH family outer membrane protein [Prevotellaceae bacterium]MDO4931927.1 OmpH family outer membrane protein [Prevotellaceae bacterium]
MTKKNLFSAITVGAMAVAMFGSCDNSPKAETDSATQPKASQELKIAFVEVDSLITQYEFCKEYTQILEKKSRNIQSTLQQKGQKLQSDATNFQQKLQQNALDRATAERMQAALQKQNSDLEALQQRLGAEIQEETNKYNQALHDSVQHFIAKYNKNKKYTMILSKSGDNILYADKGVDITAEVVAGLNKAYKKGSVTKK